MKLIGVLMMWCCFAYGSLHAGEDAVSGSIELANDSTFTVPYSLHLLDQATGGGLGDSQIAAVSALLFAMKVDERSSMTLPIQFKGDRRQMTISIFMDDQAAPEIVVSASPEVIDLIATINKRIVEMFKL